MAAPREPVVGVGMRREAARGRWLVNRGTVGTKKRLEMANAAPRRPPKPYTRGDGGEAGDVTAVRTATALAELGRVFSPLVSCSSSQVSSAHAQDTIAPYDVTLRPSATNVRSEPRRPPASDEEHVDRLASSARRLMRRRRLTAIG